MFHINISAWVASIWSYRLTSIGTSIMNIRRSYDRLIFIMGIAIPRRRRGLGSCQNRWCPTSLTRICVMSRHCLNRGMKFEICHFTPLGLFYVRCHWSYLQGTSMILKTLFHWPSVWHLAKSYPDFLIASSVLLSLDNETYLWCLLCYLAVSFHFFQEQIWYITKRSSHDSKFSKSFPDILKKSNSRCRLRNGGHFVSASMC